MKQEDNEDVKSTSKVGNFEKNKSARDSNNATMRSKAQVLQPLRTLLIPLIFSDDFITIILRLYQRAITDLKIFLAIG